jgi:hypothetical protein
MGGDGDQGSKLNNSNSNININSNSNINSNIGDKDNIHVATQMMIERKVYVFQGNIRKNN